MYFISIDQSGDRDEFYAWLNNKSKLAFNSSEDFSTWLEGQKVFPLHLYIEGMTLEFTNRRDVDFFLLGMDINELFVR